MRAHLDKGCYDVTRHSFSRHRDDPPIRKRKNMGYNKRNMVYLKHDL